MRTIILLLLSQSFIFPSFGTIRNVPLNYSTIQEALNNCTTNDTVLVEPGIYYENIIWPNISAIKLVAVGDSTNTVIDGNHTGRTIEIAAENVDTLTIIRGFKITNGFLEGSDIGGAGVNVYGCSPKFVEVCITGNYLQGDYISGAGFNCENSSVVLENSSIAYNVIDSSTNSSAAGLSISGSGKVVLNNILICYNRIVTGGPSAALSCSVDTLVVNSCKIIHNSSDSVLNGGGALSFNDCHLTISNTVIDSNAVGAGGTWYYGGGISVDECQVLFTNVSVSYNSSKGGGTWYYGGGMYFSNSNVSLLDVNVSGNTMGDNGLYYNGGGIYLEDCTADLNSLIISSNKTGENGYYYDGGGIYLRGTTATLINVLIVNNIFNLGADDGDSGGGVYIRYGTYDPSQVEFTNVTIASNRRIDEGEIEGSAIYVHAGNYADLLNCILWNPGGITEIYSEYADVDCNYSDVRLGYSGSGNKSQNPLFISENDFHLQPNSPCIGTGKLDGAPEFDLEGTARPLPASTNPDMGCYEMDIAVSANSLSDADEFFIYPNPVTTAFTVHYKPENRKNEIALIEVCDLTGQIIIHCGFKNSESVTVDASGILPDIYICNVIGDFGNKLQTLKIIKH